MIFNHIKVFFRQLSKNTTYYIINISGLALGLASFLLILLYVNYEFSYDSFHPGADRIYRVEFGASRAPVPLVPAIQKSLPSVESAARLMFTTSGTTLVIRDAKGDLLEENCYFADSSFFKVFSYKLLSGDPRNMLPGKQHIVLTEKAARRYFSSVDVVGRQLEFASSFYEDKLFTVSAVIADLPPNSQLRFDVIIDYAHHGTYSSTTWEIPGAMSFVKLNEGADPAQVLEGIKKLAAANVADPTITDRYKLVPLSALHFSKTTGFDFIPRNNKENLLVLGSVALLIIIIACVNFINLTTAKSSEQLRGASLRQIMGAGKLQVAFQIINESVLIAVISMIIGAGLIYSAAPLYESVSGISFEVAFGLVSKYLVLLPLLPVLIGVLSGLYPAYVVSSSKPVTALTAITISDSRSTFRNVLVTLQFGISCFLVIGTLIINGQLKFMKGSQLGFDIEQVMVLNAGGPGVGERINTIREEFLKNPGIVGVAGSLTVPGDNAYLMNYVVQPGADANSIGTMMDVLVDPEFLVTMKLPMIQGSPLFRDVAGDTTDVILNEAAVKELVTLHGAEWTNPVGRLIHEVDVTDGQATIARSCYVIGVAKDFNYQSLHHAIRPMIIRADYNVLYKILVKVNTAEVSSVVDFMKERWGELVVNDRPFNYQFLNQRFALSYKRDENFGTIFKTFSLISILISCIGLYGLVLYVTERKSREISIRKVLGAGVPSLLLLFARYFIRPIGIAFILIVPLSWFGMKSWVSQFAYQDEIGVSVFIIAGAFSLIVAILTISSRVVKVSLENPVRYLKEN